MIGSRRAPSPYATVGGALLLAAGILLGSAPAAAQAPSDAQEQEARSFIDGVAGMIFGAAWPTATYERVTIGGIRRSGDGFDATVRLHGESGFGGPLWLDLTLSLRDGRVEDLGVAGHNAILAEPFTTTRTVGELLLELAEHHAEESAGGAGDAGEGDATPARVRSASTDSPLPLRVSNECHLNTQVWTRHRDEAGEWVVGGGWIVEGRQRPYLNGGTDAAPRPLLVSSPIVYFYVESHPEDTGLTLSGEHPVRLGDRVLPMHVDTLAPDGDGDLVLTVRCPGVRRLGAELRSVESYEYRGGRYGPAVRIGVVFPGTAAESAGLGFGDIVHRVDGDPVSTPAELIRRVIATPRRPLDLEILRSGRIVRVRIP